LLSEKEEQMKIEAVEEGMRFLENSRGYFYKTFYFFAKTFFFVLIFQTNWIILIFISFLIYSIKCIFEK